ncbi:MAG: PAS domain S-box protein [Anaerolineae bacterium]|nr:PAS domain S-box protein [Anaerolineae bacterium]
MSQESKKKAVETTPYQASEELYKALFEQAADGIFIANTEGYYIEVNRHGCEMMGYTREEILNLSWSDLIPTNDMARYAQQLDALRVGNPLFQEYDLRCKDGRLLSVEIRGQMLTDGSVLSLVHDITERKQVQAEYQAHLWFLESLERVNRAMQGTDDIKQMMSDVLDVTLTIFDCDRAGLIYPCDPETTVSHVPMERTRPEYPGAYASGTEIVTDPDVAQTFRIVRASSGPVKFGPEAEHPLPSAVTQRFSIQSFIGMALYPKVDKPWEFVLHQCSYPRVWTPQEEKLFQEIGRRLTDALTSLLSYHNLRESERKLEQAERIAHVGYWEYDLEQKHITWSDETYRIFGLQPQKDSIDLALYEKLIHPKDWPIIKQLIVGAGRGDQQHYSAEYRIIRPNGNMRFVYSQGTVIQDETGQPHRLFGTTQDITKRRQAEDELRASEARFRTFVDHATDAFILHDAQGTILDMNRQTCERLGYTYEELIGMPPYDFDAEIDPVGLSQILTKLDAGEVVMFDSSHRRKDGTVFPVEVRIRPFWQGQRRFAVSLIRDITERKQAEEALRASEQRYRALYRENPSMFFTLDAEGTIVALNEFGANELGYTIPELQGQSVLNVFYEEDKVAVREQILTCLQNPWQVFHWQFRKVHRDGRLMWVEENVRAVRGPDDVTYVLVVCQDITERKQLEEQNAQLTAQFHQAQKMEAIGQLAGGVAHDFNNLLVPIIGYIELNLSDIPPGSKLHADLIQVRKAAFQAADLTRQILAFSRQQVLELSLLDLNNIIEVFKKMLQRLIGEDIELQTFLAQDLVPIKADKVQIEQVLMNLAINSRDAMPDGGKLTIETANVILDETYLEKYASDLAPGSYVMLAVSDTGHGIDAETQEHIFEPFFTTKASGQGTGLGLATVFGIIKQHQGHIQVYSEPNSGTIFKLYLPKAKEANLPIIPTSQEPLSIYGTETVLVVEDEEMVRKLVCETLEAHGYDVVEAPRPTNGLKLASGKTTIHLLITDVIMPEMDGKELYQKVTALHPNSKVLYISGYTTSVIVRHGILNKGVNFLQKPFTIHSLTRKVRTVLN